MAATTLTQPATDARPVGPAPQIASGTSGLRRPVILALDLGQTTGMALRLPDGMIVSGTVEFRPSRYEGGGIAYVRFRGWLDKVHATNRLDLVVFEEVRRHLGTAAAHAYGGWLAILTSWCEQHDVPYQGVPVGTIKRFITGKGNAPKKAVIAAVKALGFDPEDDNEADAIAILRWAIAEDLAGGVR